MLDDRLPDGPWKVELMLESGLIRRTVTATLIFPGKPASWGDPAPVDSSRPWVLLLALLATVMVVTLLVLILSRRRRDGLAA